MKKILDDLGVKYKVGIGEAAFDGPKLDSQCKNVHGKEDTLITIQIDQMLSKKFGMEYVDRDGQKKNPYIIHRTSIGCYQRTLALIIEKFAGGPVGLDTLAAALGEDAGTLEDVYEPYLLKNGFLNRTARGRVATQTAYEHLGIAFPE